MKRKVSLRWNQILIDIFVENRNYHNHVLAIINEKENHINETNDGSNTSVTGPKARKDLNEIGCKVDFSSAVNRKSILCA